MNIQDFIKWYGWVEYLATDGRYYLIETFFPICLPIKNQSDLAFLDTGGQGEGIDFCTVRLVGAELHRKCDDGVWRRLTKEVRLRGVVKV